MGALIKNVLLSGFMVGFATVAASSLAGVLMLLLGSMDGEMPVDSNMIAFGMFVMILLAAVVGVLFSGVTLFFAALTMPPALLLIDWLKLPRPAMDIIGGGMAALMCAMMGISIFENDKFAGMVSGENAQIIATTALFVGCVLGYVRHRVVVRGGVGQLRADPTVAFGA